MKNFLILFFLIFSTYIVGQNEYLIADNYFRQSEFEKAAEVLKKLVTKNPYNTTYINKLVACYQETEQFKKVEDLLKKSISKNPRLLYLSIPLGYNYERQQQKDIAKTYYDKALSSIEKETVSTGIVARMFKEYNLLDYAIKTYEKATQLNPSANYSSQIAQLYGEQGNFKSMFEAFMNMINEEETNLELVQKYVSKYISDDAESENNILFKKTLLRKSASNPKDSWNRLLSWLFIQQKQYSKAFVQQKALYARDEDYLSGMVSLGEISFGNQDYETAQKAFDFVLKKTNYPQEKINAHNFKILIAIESDQENVTEMVAAVLKEYGKNDETLMIQMLYADYLTFKEKKPEAAKKILEEVMNFSTSKFVKARIKLKLGDVLVFTGKFNKALIYYTQVQNGFKNHQLAQEARFKVAQTSYFKNDFKWAMAQLKVLKRSASQLIANDAVDLYITISDNEPKDSIPTGLAKYAQADLLAFQSKESEAVLLLDEIIKEYKGQPIEDEALFKQAKLFIKQKRFDDAILNFAKIIVLDKEGIYIDDVYYHLAEMYNTKLNNKEKALEYYQKIIFEHPSSIYLVDARKKYRKLRGDTVQ